MIAKAIFELRSSALLVDRKRKILVRKLRFACDCKSNIWVKKFNFAFDCKCNNYLRNLNSNLFVGCKSNTFELRNSTLLGDCKCWIFELVNKFNFATRNMVHGFSGSNIYYERLMRCSEFVMATQIQRTIKNSNLWRNKTVLSIRDGWHLQIEFQRVKNVKYIGRSVKRFINKLYGHNRSTKTTNCNMQLSFNNWASLLAARHLGFTIFAHQSLFIHVFIAVYHTRHLSRSYISFTGVLTVLRALHFRLVKVLALLRRMRVITIIMATWCQDTNSAEKTEIMKLAANPDVVVFFK